MNKAEDMYQGANEDKAYKVPKILSVNERVQREALKTYYEQSVTIIFSIIFFIYLILRKEKHISQKKLKRVIYFAHVVNPFIAISFVVLYWIVGVYSYLYPGAEFEENLLKLNGIHQ